MSKTSIKIKAIDHIVLRISDLPSMLRFYCSVLGCKVERELPELGLTQLRAGSSLIDLVTVSGELGKVGGRAPSEEGKNLDHFCLTIAPMRESELAGLLKENGVPISEFADRYGAEGFGRSIYVQDPENNTVELKLSD